jgi:flagellar biogenesis protein FliO
MAMVTAMIKKWIDRFKSKPNWKVILFALAGLITVWAVASGGSSAADGGNANLSSPFFMLGVAVKLGGVLLLIIGGAVLLRKYQGKLPGSKSLRQVVILESVRISPRQALHLVKAGSQQLLIGATDQGIALISVVEPAAQPALEPAASAADDFQAVLQNLTSHSSPLSGLEPQQS